MSNENEKRKDDDLKKEKAPKKLNWIKWGVVINFIMLVTILMTLFNITIPLPSFAKVEYTVYTLEEPISSEILPPLKTSPSHYIELIVKPPLNVNYGDTLKFSINIKDKGKKTVGEPEFRIFIVDSIGNVRGVYPSPVANLMKSKSTNLLLINDDIEKEECKNAINFNFKMPPEDQKVIGDWKIFVYLFDKGNRILVSYNVCEFMVGRSEIAWEAIGSIVASMGVLTAALEFLFLKRRKRRRGE